MYTEQYRRFEEDATARADLQAPLRNPSRVPMGSATNIFAIQALVDEAVDLEEGEMIEDDDARHRWITARGTDFPDNEVQQPIEEDSDQIDPIFQRIDGRYLRPFRVKRRAAMDTASINPNPEQLGPAPNPTRPRIQVQSPSPPPETHWRSLKREGRPKRSLERIDTDYLLAASTVDDINNMLDSIYGLQRDQAAAIMESFTRDPDNTRSGREIDFIEAGFRSWSVRLRNPNANRRLPYVDYGEDRAAYNDLPDHCKTNGCYKRCPAPRTKDDEWWSLRRGRMLQRREKNLNASASTAKSSTGALPETLRKLKDRFDMPPPLPVRRKSSIQADDPASQGSHLTPTGSSAPTVESPSTSSYSSQSQSPPRPRSPKMKLKLNNTQHKAIAAVRPPPVDHSKDIPSNLQLREAIRKIQELEQEQREVAMELYQDREDDAQGATETMSKLQARASHGLRRAPWAAHSPLCPPDRRWAANPGAAKGSRPGYYRFAGVVKSTQSFYGRRVPSLHQSGDATSEERRLSRTERTKIHKIAEAWRVNPDAY